ncbi:hypothetical protein KKF45_05650 [Patescibacteria group bacterium]|nr:hypothetical protein [Patescibacteria group bacterium]
MPALTKVLQIRSQRKLFYGDRWKEDPDWALLAEIRQKYLRLEHSLLRDLKKEESAEKDLVIDTLIDLTVYSLFLLNNFLDREDTCE